MRLVDARRLTGPTHLARRPLVVVELALDEGEALADVVAIYRRELWRLRAARGFAPEVEVLVRAHRGGATVAYEAPIDVMLASAEASEWAALSAVEALAGRAALPLEPRRAEIAAILARDASPRLLALDDEARRRGVPLLWDDEIVSVGTGRGSKAFPRHELPAVADVAWDTVRAIPVALVTGTNGKTTSSRLLARMAREASLRVALASTDGIEVGSETLEDGDWTGPGAARIALRRDDVELAVLETARGGILRRGLAVETCDAALITNVSADHLGLYGIDDIAAMAEVKGVVAHAVRSGGTAVLNAHDPLLVALAPSLSCHVTFFADLEGDGAAARPVIEAALARGGRAVVAEGGAVVAVQAGERVAIARIADLPITFGGAARYNVQNVLGAVATARALGLPDAAIAAALRAFGMEDNPGRGQVVVRRGITVVLDFGHNAQGVRAVMSFVASLRGPQGRLQVVTGSPGDRTDDEIEAVARAIHECSPARVYLRELGDYLRGRDPGEVPALFARAFRALGMPDARFVLASSEVDAVAQAFAAAAPGDVIVVLVHLDKAGVHAFLDAQA
ncbi:MAG TPA: Mur ligase family protein [Labilithrix sp.]|nr:Mur ligase family protein [Labilithrix sp.]